MLRTLFTLRAKLILRMLLALCASFVLRTTFALCASFMLLVATMNDSVANDYELRGANDPNIAAKPRQIKARSDFILVII